MFEFYFKQNIRNKNIITIFKRKKTGKTLFEKKLVHSDEEKSFESLYEPLNSVRNDVCSTLKQSTPI